MRILVTGDKGFIGRNLYEAYKKKGNQVFGWRREGISANRKMFSFLNLMNYAEVKKGIDEIRPDLILHCAGSADVNYSLKNPFYDMQNNYITTHNLLFAMKELQMLECRFVLMSSAAVYGNPSKLPISESYLTEPLSPYALHKKAAEDVCLFMHKNYGFDVKVLRIFSAYGPGLKKQLFWDMYQKIKQTNELNLWGGGEESRDYIYIDDLISAIMLVAEKAPYENIFYNIANGEEIKIKRAAQILSDYLNFDKEKIQFVGKQKEGNPVNWRGNINKLLSLGYIRTVKFEEGIKRYIRWLNEENL